MNANRYGLSAADAAVVAEMRAASAEHKSDLFGPEARSSSDAELAAAPPAPQEISYQHGTVAGVPGWWVRPVNATPGARLLYLHGGGFVLGSATATRHFAAHLALRIRAEAFVPDYRLAPENPFPAAVEDAVKVYDALSATAEKIVVSGDSAGGGLALALLGTLAGRDEKQHQPVGVAVFSPWADLALTGDSYISRAEADPFVSKATLKHFADQYLKGTDPTNPAASPLYGLTPRTSIPVRIDVGNHEILFDDSVRYAEKLTRAGLSVSLNIWDGMGHGFQAAIGVLGNSATAIEDVGAFLQSCLLFRV